MLVETSDLQFSQAEADDILYVFGWRRLFPRKRQAVFELVTKLAIFPQLCMEYQTLFAVLGFAD